MRSAQPVRVCASIDTSSPQMNLDAVGVRSIKSRDASVISLFRDIEEATMPFPYTLRC